MAATGMSKVIEGLRNAVVRRDEAGLADGQLLGYFVGSQDEAAFEALVRRHGPMVLGVCRRVLRHDQDAEDAFQATFLVLVRKAASVRPREMVANWLYGVACNAALKGKASAARRRARERQLADMPEPEALHQNPADDLERLLDQELARLPDKYRPPIVLCGLEGKSYKEAARELGVTEGTVSVRLVRARAMLRRRLAHHGMAVTAGTLAAMIAPHAALAAVPASLVGATVKAASLLASGPATAVVSAEVVSLMQGVLKTMLLTKLKVATAVVLAVAAAGAGAGSVIYGARAERAASAASAQQDAGPMARAPLKAPRDKAMSKELEELQGTWILMTVEEQGVKKAAEEVARREIKLVFEGDKLTMTRKRLGSVKWKLAIDPAGMKMDWSAVRPEDGKVIEAKGIYRVSGDTLAFCYGEERPKTFKPDRELDQRLFVFKREKPARKADGEAGRPKSADGFVTTVGEHGLHDGRVLKVWEERGMIQWTLTMPVHPEGVATVAQRTGGPGSPPRIRKGSPWFLFTDSLIAESPEVVWNFDGGKKMNMLILAEKTAYWQEVDLPSEWTGRPHIDETTGLELPRPPKEVLDRLPPGLRPRKTHDR